MSIKLFKFRSPAIMVQEVDNSQLPKEGNRKGPVIITRTSKGPGMRPVTIESFSDFVEMFGNPVAGGQGGDVWREGNFTSPMYGTYAAQAYLRNNTPVTIVRLLGYDHADAATAGKAGWECKNYAGTSNGIGTADASGGAYGLFLINSSSHGVLNTSSGSKDTTPATGSLAAIWYFNEGSITLTGSLVDGSGTASGSAVLLKCIGTDKEFRAIVRDRDGNVVKTTTFNFNRNSQKYIRKVFNTNPTLTNSTTALGANTASYWLGETFERQIDNYVTNNTANTVFGMILGLKGTTGEGHNHRTSAQPAQTGWIFSQDTQVVSGAANTYQPENMVKLFKLHCLDTGEWTQKNVKISIQDIKTSTSPYDLYGVFSVLVRKADDSDAAPVVLERYSSCNLNPNSPNYVARKIGDKYISWDDTERRYIEYGNYDNRSRYIRAEMNADVEAGATNPEFLPFGVYGPIRFKGFTVISGSTAAQTMGVSNPTGSNFSAVHVAGGSSICRANVNGSEFIKTGNLLFTGAFIYPALTLRSSSAWGNLASPKNAYFGIDNSISSGSTRTDKGYGDYLRMLPADYGSFTTDASNEVSWYFTLDDLCSGSGTATSTAGAIYCSGSRAAGTSVTAQSSLNHKGILDLGFDRFTTPLYGGFDGLDITEKEPFRNSLLEGKTETTHYTYNSVKRAIDCVADQEVVECNLLTYPGLTHEGLTSHMLTVAENRGDCLAIIDLKGGFVPSTENNSGDSATANRGDVDTTISNLTARGINSSYGCAYYPWVQIVDTLTNTSLWAPPSVVALGVMGNSEAKSELWFAPAGFNRGGLTEGSAGIPVTGVREKLTSKQRDKLYEANINSIASFPSEGVVVFGQKTLQTTASALDRINVRRLLIYVKTEMAAMAKGILFDQNVQATWNRYKSQAEPFLLGVKNRMGLSDYRLILDETTTTPELIDRNVMYAKILLKPAKAIEYIALEFSISSEGVSFND